MSEQPLHESDRTRVTAAPAIRRTDDFGADITRAGEITFARVGDDSRAFRDDAPPMSATPSPAGRVAARFLRRATLPALALVVGSATLALPYADGQTGRTLTFHGSAPTARDVKPFDVRPRGLSTGDHFIGAVALRRHGRMTGRLHLTCIILDRSYRGQDCQGVLVLRDGTITVSGGGLDRLLPGQPPSPPDADEMAITGGTGAYRSATGVVAMQEHKDDSSTITVSL